MKEVSLEVLVKPFRENDPGPWVQAVVAKLSEAGLDPEMGPFATTVSADVATISAVLGEMVEAGINAGATSLQLRLDVTQPDS